MVDKLVMQKDVESKLNTYKVMMSEVHGYYIDVPASSPEEALKFAKAGSYYEEYGRKVVDREPVEVVEDEKIHTR
tara:strand:- start:1036 stop:1260 length:225 start_codon:yes stop_codon:yes gene_type:complete